MRANDIDFREGRHGRSLTVWAAAAALIPVPVLAIRGFGPAAWDLPGDFIFLATLMVGVGTTYELASRVPLRRAYQSAAVVALIAVLLSAWINLAVGIIGSENNPANLMFAGPIVIAGLGAALTRFRATGMANTMTAAAIAQGMVFVAALVSGYGFTGPISVFFTALWLISAWLFRKAGQRD